MKKRLFLFAGYDKDNIIDKSLQYYIKSLSKLGDIILCMDCKCPQTEIDKISKYCLHIINIRHKEYDFGSYKRAYIYAKSNGILDNYKYIYLVNDSVFGPLFDMTSTIEKLESMDTPAFGLVKSKHRNYSAIESWFVGMKQQIAVLDQFQEFITSIKTQQTKNMVTVLYENGLTEFFNKNHILWKCLFNIHGRQMYNKPKYMFVKGCPFIKKSSFTRHNGGLSCQIKYILNHTTIKKNIINSITRLYGDKYVQFILHANGIACLIRKIKYVLCNKIIK